MNRISGNNGCGVVLCLAFALLYLSSALPAHAQVPFVDALQVAAHDSHSCAVSSGGGVKCWGRNNYGQLGDNSSTRRLTAVDVSGLTSGVAAVATGDRHTCALSVAGGVKCWGDNSNGQLGDNSTTQRLTAVDVSGLGSGVIAIALAASHTCAVTSVGGVKCWGWNGNGQLGDGSTTQRLTPVDVSGLTSGVTAVAASSLNACVLTSSGGVKCWGSNSTGQLGDGSTTQSLTAVDVSGLTSGVTAITTGSEFACALTSGGGVKCWGENASGQLGDNSIIRSLTAVDVSGLTSGVTAITAGFRHACALLGDGAIECWGGNPDGQLGDNSTTTRLTAVDVSGLTSGVVAIAPGFQHSCGLNSGGGVTCWGGNSAGQLGDNSTTTRLTAVDVSGLTSSVIAIAAGFQHACGLSSGGGLKCWGSNALGQLGDDSTTTRLTAVDVSGLTSGVIEIATGFRHSCALTSGGGVKCWGDNSGGQLGDGSTANSLTPVDVSGLAGVIAITSGFRHSCALDSGGGVKCWGSNNAGQLGDESTTTRLSAVDVSGLTSGVIAIAAGAVHTCALTSGGGVKCWGSNRSGQLGNGSTANSLSAGDVTGLASGITAIATGSYDPTSFGLDSHTCALTGEGGVKCWGDNSSGQLGDGSTARRLTPVDAVGLTSGVTAIAAGAVHTCALTNGGGAKCWGSNASGRLGDGTQQFVRPFPAAALEMAVSAAPIIGIATASNSAASVIFTAPAKDGGTPITGYTATSLPGDISSGECLASPCTVEGLTNGIAYTFTVTASNALGTSAASAASNNVTPKAEQDITLGSMPSVVVDGTGTISAGGGASGNPVVFTSLTPGTCTASGIDGSTVTGVSVGICSLAANQAGSAAFNAAPEMTASFSIDQGTQSTFTVASTPSTIVFGASSVLGTSGGSGAGAVNLAVSAGPATCSITDSTLTAIGVGSCTVSATKAADANYLEASATVDISVEQAPQTIVFGSDPIIAVGGTGTVSATGGDSGNAVVFASQTTDVCTVSDTSITGVSAGSCTIAANQDGTDNYAAAPQVTQTFAVEAATASIVVGGDVNPANVGETVTFTATVSGQAPTGTVDFMSDTLVIDGCAAQPITGGGPATASCTTDQLAAGTPAITAIYSGDANNSVAISDPLQQVINAFPTLDAVAEINLLEDGSDTFTVTLADAETTVDLLQLTATSSDPSLIDDAALAAGLGGSDGNRTLAITPIGDAFGSATLTLTVTDDDGAATPHTIELTVAPVNDPPLAGYGITRTHPAAAVGVQSIPGFVTGISAGPPNEVGQLVDFETVIVSNAEAIVSDLSIDAEGTLRYTLNSECIAAGSAPCDALISVGAAEVELTAVDDGGRENGGNDRGVTHTLLIVVGDAIIDLTVDIERLVPADASLNAALAGGATMASYQISVGNNGPLPASGARVAMSRQLGLLDVLWTCVAPAACVPGNGDDALDTRFDLAAGQMLTIELGGEVDLSQPFVDLLVQVFAPAGITAVFRDDDSAALIEAAGPTGVFKDGLER